MNKRKTVVAILFLLLLSGCLLAAGATSARESYGGPIKVLRRIPKTECETICDNHFYDCLRKTRMTDYDLCEKKAQACKAICRYTNFQRL